MTEVRSKAVSLKDFDLLERLASVTEELEDIVASSQEKKQKEIKINMDELLRNTKKRLGNKIPIRTFNTFHTLVLRNLIKGRMGTSAYMLGKSIGIDSKPKTKDDIIDLLHRFDINGANIKEYTQDKVVVRINDGITALGVRKSPRPLCYFEGGLLAGSIEKLINATADLVETKCAAMGDPYCQFELLSSKSKSARKEALPFFPIDSYSHENIRLLTMLASHAISSIESTLLIDRRRKEAEIDGLTRVYNHRYFQQAIRAEHKHAQRNKIPLSLIMLDVDSFKHYNDTFGHPKGDKVLKEIAALLVNSVRGLDVVARYGGDEFAVILPKTPEEGAMLVARRLRDKVGGLKVKGDKAHKDFNLTISLGVSTYTRGPQTALNLINKSDKALLKAKKKGKSVIMFLPLGKK